MPISKEEMKRDLSDNEKELKDLKDQLEILERNPIENRLKIYMIEGNICRHIDLSHRIKELLK